MPSQDVVLGLYYMTRALENAKGEGMVFANVAEGAARLRATARCELHAKVKVRMHAIEMNDDGKPQRADVHRRHDGRSRAAGARSCRTACRSR